MDHTWQCAENMIDYVTIMHLKEMQQILENLTQRRTYSAPTVSPLKLE